MNNDLLIAQAGLADQQTYADEFNDTQSLLQTKQDRLLKRKEKKLTRLGTNYESLPGNINAGVHDFDISDGIRELSKSQVFASTDGTGNKVTLTPDYEDPTLVGPHNRDEFTETPVPLNRWGKLDTRNAYMKLYDNDTPKDYSDDIEKFGLARNDLNKEAIAKGYTPETARYSNQKEFWPYEGPRVIKGKDRAYDGTVIGEMGNKNVQVLSDTEYLADAATKFEFNKYMDRGTINSRARGLGSMTKAERDAFSGGGSSEYIYSDMRGRAIEGIEAGTSTPRIPYGFNKDEIGRAHV